MRSHSFEDFDAFAASVRDVECTMMLQNPAHRLWTITQANIDAIDVQLGTLGSGNIVEGQSWSHGLLVYLPLSSDVEYSLNGTALHQHDFMVLEPSCEFCISTKFKHDWCSVFIPTDRFIGDGDPMASSHEPASYEAAQCRVAHADRQTVTRFWSIVKEIMFASVNASDFHKSPASKSAAAEVRRVVGSIVGPESAKEPKQVGRPLLPRHEIIRRCRQLINARAGRALHIDDFIAEVAVSERTLRQAFYDYYGVGPVRYVQLRQLHQLYRALRASDPKATRVGDVLADYGIWEFGRFASRYRQLFGERPSDTLRRTNS